MRDSYLPSMLLPVKHLFPPDCPGVVDVAKVYSGPRKIFISQERV